MKTRLNCLCPKSGIVLAFFIGLGSASYGMSIDLSSWNSESYATVNGFPPASWVLSANSAMVTEAANG